MHTPLLAASDPESVYHPEPAASPEAIPEPATCPEAFPEPPVLPDMAMEADPEQLALPNTAIEATLSCYAFALLCV